MFGSISAWAGLATAGVSGLGAVKTLVQVASGRSVEMQEIAFYFGAAAVAVYFGLGAGLVAGGAVAGISQAIAGGEVPRAAGYVAVIVGGAVGLAIIVVLAQAGVLFDYQGTDGFGRGVIGLLGLFAVGGGIYLWRRNAK